MTVLLEKFFELALVLARFAPRFARQQIDRRDSSLFQTFLFVIFFAAMHRVSLPRKFKRSSRSHVRPPCVSIWRHRGCHNKVGLYFTCPPIMS